jgi:hypothetical protein
MHVLDAVMVPLEQLNSTNATASGTPSAQPSATVTNTVSPTAATSTAAAPLMEISRYTWGLWAFGASLMALL